MHFHKQEKKLTKRQINKMVFLSKRNRISAICFYTQKRCARWIEQPMISDASILRNSVGLNSQSGFTGTDRLIYLHSALIFCIYVLIF